MRRNWKTRIFFGLLIASFAFIKYCSSKETNPYTGREQAIALEPKEEIAMGLQSAPQMIKEYGGMYSNRDMQNQVDDVGESLVNASIAKESPYKYDFHLLSDRETVNAFALPGGQIFITYALYARLENEDQLAGVLGHEIGHVLGRHSSERIANTEFWQTLSQGAAVGADAGDFVAGIGQNTLLTNGREDELESDDLGVKFMMEAGYDPYEMVKVMEILKAAAGPNRVPEFKSTHPDPDNRIEKIKESIRKYREN
jgi:predicted Zn-dependent protease